MKKHELTVSEDDAKDCVIHVNIDRKGHGKDSIFTIRFLEEDEGTLFLEVSEDSNPDTCIQNHYPEYFTIYQEDKRSLTTTVDGEII